MPGSVFLRKENWFCFTSRYFMLRCCWSRYNRAYEEGRECDFWNPPLALMQPPNRFEQMALIIPNQA